MRACWGWGHQGLGMGGCKWGAGWGGRGTRSHARCRAVGTRGGFRGTQERCGVCRQDLGEYRECR